LIISYLWWYSGISGSSECWKSNDNQKLKDVTLLLQFLNKLKPKMYSVFSLLSLSLLMLTITTDSMGFGIYSLIEAGVLLINALAILNEERFLSKSELLAFYL
jgi:hypothetical protein